MAKAEQPKPRLAYQEKDLARVQRGMKKQLDKLSPDNRARVAAEVERHMAAARVCPHILCARERPIQAVLRGNSKLYELTEAAHESATTKTG